MATTLLDVDDVRLSFGGVHALDGASLTVTDAHSFWGLIGPNGSGKTTLFNLISGIYAADAGVVSGTSTIRHRGSVPGLGRTFQHPRVFERMTAQENLLAASRGMRSRAAERKAADLVDLLELGPVVDRRAGELSIGQQKLVELARALMRDPQLVLLDEVAAGIHPRLRARIAGYLRELAGRGTRFLIIEHDMRFLMDLCSQLYCVAHGKTIASGSPEQIRDDPRVAAEYLGRGDHA
ncbi:MAG: ABC transporter ATP-binding protein [Nocardioidaceae bacterium]